MAVNTTATLTTTMQTYNDRKTLEIAKTKFVYAQFGQKKPLPKNSGKVISWRRYNLFTPSVSGQALTEGVVPTEQNLSQATVNATVAQYGAFVKISDLLDLTALDDVVRDSSVLLGEQLGTVVDWATRDAMLATTNVQFGGGASSAANIASTCVMTIAEIRKAVRTLKKNKARPFNGGRGDHFICVVSPDVAYDIQNDTDWKAVRQYQDKEAIYNGELGRMFGVVFVESTEAYSDTSGIHHSLIFGADAYGIVDIEGSGGIKTYIKPAGSAGTADPLNQISTVGAKVMAYAAKVLNPNWIIDIQTYATA